MAGELQTITPETPPTAPAAHTPRYKRITQEQLRTLLALRRAGKTQVEIAHILGCSQGTVCRWLDDFKDSRDEATDYLRSKALTMAMNVVRRGKPREHVVALQGLSVLKDERAAGVQVFIGVKDSDVTVTLSPPAIAEGERKPAELRQIQAGSDKARYVNEP